MMHPALAIWIWSMAMARACFGQGPENMGGVKGASGAFLQQVSHQSLIRASEYLYSDLSEHPLPNELLDRLADLYWAERDGHLAI